MCAYGCARRRSACRWCCSKRGTTLKSAPAPLWRAGWITVSSAPPAPLWKGLPGPGPFRMGNTSFPQNMAAGCPNF
ncbi:MAG: hypothetical protein ACLRWF_10105 [Ruthenibacterium sp.]